MGHFSEMEWNAKWDWENFAEYGSKSIESAKKLQSAEWSIVNDGVINVGSFNLVGGGGSSGASGSDGGYGSSARSSISASTDSSMKDGMHNPNFRFMNFEGSSGNISFSKKTDLKRTQICGVPLPEASVGSAEPLIGLKLGKRTYFENSGAGGNVNSSSLSAMPTSSTPVTKKMKLYGQNSPIPRCQVEGCNIDLSTAKEYHRKHRVCDSHSKCAKVIIGGLERRFCQQCSRFHGLSDFDEKKRSCRRRLSDHNARRRKPHQETIQFDSTRLLSSYYGGTQHMSFLLNSSPLVHPKTANSVWDCTYNTKFMLTKGCSLKSNRDDGTDEQLLMPGVKLPHAVNMHDAASGLLVSKNSMSEVLHPGSNGSLISSHIDAAAPEYRRALSLLSSNSWDSCEPESVQLQHHPMHAINPSSITQPMIQAIPACEPEPIPLWLTGQHSANTRFPSSATNSSFHDSQLFKPPYEADFYSNMPS